MRADDFRTRQALADLKRAAGGNPDGVLWKIQPRCMQLRDQSAFFLLAAEFVCGTRLQPFVERGGIHFQNEHAVEKIGEPVKISRTAAEEGLGMAMIGDQGPDLFHIPDMVPVPEV